MVKPLINKQSKTRFGSRNKLGVQTKNKQNKKTIQANLDPQIQMSWRGHAINWSRAIIDGDIVMGQVKLMTDKCVKVALFKNITRDTDINEWVKLYIHAISDSFITMEKFKKGFDIGDIIIAEISNAKDSEITIKPKYCGGISIKCDKTNCGVFTPGPICHNCNKKSVKKMADVKYVIQENCHYIIVNNLRLFVY